MDTLVTSTLQSPTIILVAVISALLAVFLYRYLKKTPRALSPSEAEVFRLGSHLQESEARFRLAFDYASVGMAFLSVNGRFMRVNPALCQMLGYTESELFCTTLKKMMNADDYQLYERKIEKIISGKENHFRAEQRFYHKTGTPIWVLSSISRIKEKEKLYFIGQLQNISVEKSAQQQLEHLAYHDPLTGLANRNRLMEQINDVFANARRHRTGFAFMFMDLDHFKNINDTIGHDAGDILLQIVAERLKGAVRITDIICRLGGDEFVIVITDIDKVDPVIKITEKIISSLLKPMLIKGQDIYITVSAGISVYPYDGHDIHALMRSADLALYRAKELGRNNYQFCTPEMTAKAREKMARQNALAQALIRNEFFILYQPKLNFKTWSVSGVEVLLRWNNPEYSKVTPEEIISLAEEVGLIIPLCEWILDSACKQLKSWQKAGIPMMSVAINISAKQFKQPHFADTILTTLEKNQFLPQFLELEVTEGLIMQDPDYALRTLQKLKERGVCLAIDDFGTGYSSLAYLRKLEVNKIKIDKSFTQRLLGDSGYNGVVKAMIAMATKLDIKVIAEGVENKEQCAFLFNEQCTEIQGYFLSVPLAAEAMQGFLSDPQKIAMVAQAVGIHDLSSSRFN